MSDNDSKRRRNFRGDSPQWRITAGMRIWIVTVCSLFIWYGWASAQEPSEEPFEEGPVIEEGAPFPEEEFAPPAAIEAPPEEAPPIVEAPPGEQAPPPAAVEAPPPAAEAPPAAVEAPPPAAAEAAPPAEEAPIEVPLTEEAPPAVVEAPPPAAVEVAPPAVVEAPPPATVEVAPPAAVEAPPPAAIEAAPAAPQIPVTAAAKLVPGTIIRGMPQFINVQTKHRVEAGDDLHLIAARYYGNARLWTKILEANSSEVRNPNVLEVGQVLVIPSP